MQERHVLNEVDLSSGTGDCQLCGLVRVKPKGASWLCVNKIAEGQLWYRYRVTLRWKDDRLIALGNRCSCCGEKPNDKGLFVDHDHKTGKARDLVCENCNFMIGHGQDDPERLRAGADYLERWQ